MTDTAYCPRCGVERISGGRFCAKCGLDYWGVAAGRPVEATPAAGATGTEATPAAGATGTEAAPTAAARTDETGTATVRTLAGVAWIISAALIGYLAFLQLQYAQNFLGDRLAGETMGLAVGNGISAAVTLFFAGKLLLGPTRRFLLLSAGWGVLSVVWGAVQISQGVTADVFIGATVSAGVAGVLSFVAWVQRGGA